MPPIAHPGRLLKRELEARALSANRLALDLGVAPVRFPGIRTRGVVAEEDIQSPRHPTWFVPVFRSSQRRSPAEE